MIYRTDKIPLYATTEIWSKKRDNKVLLKPHGPYIGAAA